MVCPKCQNNFIAYNFNGITIKICKNCHGIMLKFSDLEKLGRFLELKTSLINPMTLMSESLKIKEDIKSCPQCNNTMEKIYFRGIILDKCNDCELIYFDNGELSKYFSLFMSSPCGIMDNFAFLKEYCNNTKADIVQPIKLQSNMSEKKASYMPGFLMLFLILIIFILAVCFILSGLLFVLGVIMGAIGFWLLTGFRILKPQEALVLTVFGKYTGTLRESGFHWVNPFSQNVPAFQTVSLKAMTHDSGKQKINDELGNPIEVGIIVIWEIQDTAKAMFNVDNYKQFLSAQSDSALRNIVRMYPYDTPEDSGMQSLKGDSQEISEKLKSAIQKNVISAGINIIDAKITHLAYAPEIAIAMLQRQQATAVIDAKKAIVDGAVGMVEMALEKLEQNDKINLDDSTKAQMINNLLVILCGNKESQPIIKNYLE